MSLHWIPLLQYGITSLQIPPTVQCIVLWPMRMLGFFMPYLSYQFVKRSPVKYNLSFIGSHWPKASLCGQWRLILLGVCCFWRLLYIWRYPLTQSFFMRSVKADFAGCKLFLKTAIHLKIPTDPKLLYAVSEGWFCWVYVVFEDCSTFEDTHWPKASLCGQWRLILLGVCWFWRLLYIWRYPLTQSFFMRSVKADFAGCILFLKTALHLKIPTYPKLLYAVSEGWFCWVYVVFEDCSTFEDTHWPKASLCGQ